MKHDERKILGIVLHEVSMLPLQHRAAILRAAWQLTLQKMHDAEEWHTPKTKGVTSK